MVRMVESPIAGIQWKIYIYLLTIQPDSPGFIARLISSHPHNEDLIEVVDMD